MFGFDFKAIPPWGESWIIHFTSLHFDCNER